MANENPRSKLEFPHPSPQKLHNDFHLLENEKPLQEVIVKMKMMNQVNVKRNPVIRNDQVVLQRTMKKSLKIMKNNYLIMNQMIMKVNRKKNQNENQHQENHLQNRIDRVHRKYVG
jgi:hypothetical protein